MKHAYLIIAHNEWSVLNTLLRMIDDKRNDIYLHIDKKVKVLPDLYSCRKARFNLLTNRHDVRWGDISQVRAELSLFETAYQNGPYLYYHLLSGVDLPLKNQDEIHSFFNFNQGKEFIGYFHGDYHKQDVQRKVSKRYLLNAWNKKCPFLPWWKRTTGQVIRHTFLKLQYLINYNRAQEVEFKKGHQWVSITHNAVSLLLEKKHWIFTRFHQVNTPDEIYKQTIIWNSPLRSNLYNMEDDKLGAMRNIDWERGEPYIWQNKDIEELLISPYMFARKMNGSQQDLLDKLLKRSTHNGITER